MISLATEDYFYQKEFNVVKRLITLYDLHPNINPSEGVQIAEGVKTQFEIKGFIEKKEISDWYFQGMPGTNDTLVDNRIVSEDFFGPWSIHE